MVGKLYLLGMIFLVVITQGLWSGALACTYNPATLEAEWWNGVGSLPVRSNSLSIDRWIVWQCCNPVQREEPD